MKNLIYSALISDDEDASVFFESTGDELNRSIKLFHGFTSVTDDAGSTTRFFNDSCDSMSIRRCFTAYFTELRKESYDNIVCDMSMRMNEMQWYMLTFLTMIRTTLKIQSCSYALHH